MGERYWISGVQIGMIIAYIQCQQTDEVYKLLKKVEDKQFIGHTTDLKDMLEKRRMI